MKNFKRFAAVTIAGAMVASNVFSAMAENEGAATGTGDYEGYVEEVSIFTVDVPTAAGANQFDFFVDPNGLLEETNYARISGATAADFETGATLFFTRTPDANSTPAVVKYGKDSEAITLTNKSSYAVNVEVSATVEGAEKITLGEIEDDTTAPTINLAIVSGSDRAAITADGGKLTGTIEGADDNFEIQWDDDEQKYVYAEIETPDEDAWQTYSFNLTGDCGGTWTAAQADVEPTVKLTWKVTDPKASLLSLADGVLTAKIDVADFQSGSLKIGTTVGALDTRAGKWGGNDGAVTFTFNSTWANAMKGQNCVVTVTLKDGSTIEESFNVAE